MLDPIDGTRGFVSGTPTWGVLIAVTEADGPLYGIIDQPYTGERFEGGLGRAGFTGPHGARPLRSRGPAPAGRGDGLHHLPRGRHPGRGRGLRRRRPAARLTRYGMDCYAYALLARGRWTS